MAYTTPPTFSGGDVLAASDLDILGDDISYLKDQADAAAYMAVQVNRNANQSIPDSTSTAVIWDTQQFDLGGWWSSGTDIVVPAGAIATGATTIACRVFGKVFFASNATGTVRRTNFLLNGTIFAQFTSAPEDTSGINVINIDIAPSCVAGDVITMEVTQDSGGSLNITATITVERAGTTS